MIRLVSFSSRVQPRKVVFSADTIEVHSNSKQEGADYEDRNLFDTSNPDGPICPVTLRRTNDAIDDDCIIAELKDFTRSCKVTLSLPNRGRNLSE